MNKIQKSISELNLANNRTIFEICESVITKSASIVAALVFGMVIYCKDYHVDEKNITIGVEGAVIEHMHGYKEKFLSTLSSLKEQYSVQEHMDLKYEFRLISEKDTTIKGVTLIAYADELLFPPVQT